MGENGCGVENAWRSKKDARSKMDAKVKMEETMKFALVLKMEVTKWRLGGIITERMTQIVPGPDVCQYYRSSGSSPHLTCCNLRAG